MFRIRFIAAKSHANAAKLGSRASQQACRTRRLRHEPLEERRLLSGAGGQQPIELFSVSPALFVENQGQWEDESARFVHQGEGFNVAMTDAGPVFELFQRKAAEDPQGDRLGQSGAAPQGFHPTPDEPEDFSTQTARFSKGIQRSRWR